jgi:16S rRNA (guanine1207-N2)-methyltransferase
MTHYFTNDSNIKSNLKKIVIKIKNKDYSLFTDSGIFSRNELDFGTKILIENLPINRIIGKVLDVGCGYGPIGIFIATNTVAEVHMIDVNLRALHLTRLNVKEHKLDNVKVYESNIYAKVTEKFSFIITNPPIRAGKKVVYGIIFDAIKHLKKAGELWIVIRKDQGAKSLLKDMESVYKTEIVYKKSGFFVISAKIR